MTRISVVLRSCIVGALSVVASAQRQTSAHAGVPVPEPPSSSAGAATTDTSPSFVFRVRVLDGRNGAAFRQAHVTLWYDEPAGAGYQFITADNGYANMPEPVGQPVRVLVTFPDSIDCRKPLRGSPPTGYNLQSIASTGMVAENGCGNVTVHTRPGELVLFVRPARWYEGINRNQGN